MSPKINYFFEAGTTINCFANGANTMFTGYLFAPDSRLVMHDPSALIKPTLKYNGKDSSDFGLINSGFTSIGSVVAGSIDSSNSNKTIAYVDPSNTAPDAGEPLFAWQKKLYTRY